MTDSPDMSPVGIPISFAEGLENIATIVSIHCVAALYPPSTIGLFFSSQGNTGYSSATSKALLIMSLMLPLIPPIRIVGGKGEGENLAAHRYYYSGNSSCSVVPSSTASSPCWLSSAGASTISTIENCGTLVLPIPFLTAKAPSN